MYTIGYVIIAVAKVIDLALTAYFWIIIIRAVMSWIHPDPYNPFVRFVHAVTEPVMAKIRHRLPLFFGGFDFTPIVVLLAITFLKASLVASLYRFGSSLV